MALRRVIRTYVASAASESYPATLASDPRVQCTGAGGGGTTDVGAGGGGAYAEDTDTGASPSDAYAIVIGAAAANTNGGDTSHTRGGFSVIAKGGLSGANGGTGGQASASTGSVKNNGGNGHIGTGNAGGGGAGGEAGAGGNGSATAHGTGAEKTGAGASAIIGNQMCPGSGGRSQSADQATGGRGEARVSFDVDETSWAYPRFRELDTARSTGNNTSVVVSLPAGNANHRVTVVVLSDSSPTLTIADGSWTKLGQHSRAAGDQSTLAVFTKLIGGSDETSVTVSSTQSESYHTWVFVDADAAEPELTFSDGDNIANPDPGGHTRPGGSAVCLWRTMIGYDTTNSGSVTISAPPSGWDDAWAPLANRGQVNGASGYSAFAQKYATSASEDPGPWTATNFNDWVAVTLSYASTATGGVDEVSVGVAGFVGASMGGGRLSFDARSVAGFADDAAAAGRRSTDARAVAGAIATVAQSARVDTDARAATSGAELSAAPTRQETDNRAAASASESTQAAPIATSDARGLASSAGQSSTALPATLQFAHAHSSLSGHSISVRRETDARVATTAANASAAARRIESALTPACAAADVASVAGRLEVELATVPTSGGGSVGVGSASSTFEAHHHPAASPSELGSSIGHRETDARGAVAATAAASAARRIDTDRRGVTASSGIVGAAKRIAVDLLGASGDSTDVGSTAGRAEVGFETVATSGAGSTDIGSAATAFNADHATAGTSAVGSGTSSSTFFAYLRTAVSAVSAWVTTELRDLFTTTAPVRVNRVDATPTVNRSDETPRVRRKQL